MYASYIDAGDLNLGPFVCIVSTPKPGLSQQTLRFCFYFYLLFFAKDTHIFIILGFHEIINVM